MKTSSTFASASHLGAIALVLALALAGGAAFYVHALRQAMCRGTPCFAGEAYRFPKTPTGFVLTNVCAYAGPPTGIGIFRDMPFGALARDHLGMEYTWFSREFLYVKTSGLSPPPIIVVNASDYIVEFEHDELCSEHLLLDVNEKAKRISIARSP